jgi:hypothetical protein
MRDRARIRHASDVMADLPHADHGYIWDLCCISFGVMGYVKLRRRSRMFGTFVGPVRDVVLASSLSAMHAAFGCLPSHGHGSRWRA